MSDNVIISQPTIVGSLENIGAREERNSMEREARSCNTVRTINDTYLGIMVLLSMPKFPFRRFETELHGCRVLKKIVSSAMYHTATQRSSKIYVLVQINTNL